MAALSDQLLVVATMAYLVAMICHAAEFAFGNRSLVARAAAQPARELVTVGGGSDLGDKLPREGSAVSTIPTGAPQPTGRAAVAGRAAVVVTAIAALAHIATLLTRAVAAHRVPWGNMYEFVLTLTFIGAVTWLVVLSRRPAIRHLGLFVALAEVLLLGVAGMVIYTPIVPLVPALNSYWLFIHVTAMALSSGVFLLGFVAAAMYLIRSGYEQDRPGFPYILGRRVPAADALERMTFRLHAFAFPIWTFAVISGAIWAEAAWGRYWGWDPKETWAFISWVVYAGYLHARSTPSVKRATATWISIIAWLTMLMNLFAVNLLLSGLHSYAGVN